MELMEQLRLFQSNSQNRKQYVAIDIYLYPILFTMCLLDHSQIIGNLQNLSLIILQNMTLYSLYFLSLNDIVLTVLFIIADINDRYWWHEVSWFFLY